MFSDSNGGTLYEAIPCIAFLQRLDVAKQLTDLKGNYLDINGRVDESPLILLLQRVCISIGGSCPVTASVCKGSGAVLDCKAPLRSISTEIDR